jgi:3-isopropylmalate dehydratase small subunit
VNLATQKVTLHTDNPVTYSFAFDPAIKENILLGLDDIGQTLEHESAITVFENRTDGTAA